MTGNAPTAFGASLLAGFAALAMAGAAHGQLADNTILSEGKFLYEEAASGFGCAMCHGEEARGDPMAGGTYIRGVSQSMMQSAMTGGVAEMTGLFDSLSSREEDAILAYLQYLGEVDSMMLDPRTAEGKVIFELTAGEVGCATCHGEDATGGLIGPDIHTVAADPANIADALMTVPEMGFIDLTEEEAAAVADYMRYLHDLGAH